MSIETHFFHNMANIECRVLNAEYKAWIQNFNVVDSLTNSPVGTLIDNYKQPYDVENWNDEVLLQRKKEFCVNHNIRDALALAALIALIGAAIFSGFVASAFWCGFLVVLIPAVITTMIIDSLEIQFGAQKLKRIQELWRSQNFASAVHSSVQRWPVTGLNDKSRPLDNEEDRIAFLKKFIEGNDSKQGAEIFAKLHLHFKFDSDSVLSAFHRQYVQELNAKANGEDQKKQEKLTADVPIKESQRLFVRI